MHMSQSTFNTYNLKGNFMRTSTNIAYLLSALPLCLPLFGFGLVFSLALAGFGLVITFMIDKIVDKVEIAQYLKGNGSATEVVYANKTAMLAKPPRWIQDLSKPFRAIKRLLWRT